MITYVIGDLKKTTYNWFLVGFTIVTPHCRLTRNLTALGIFAVHVVGFEHVFVERRVTILCARSYDLT